RQMVSTGNFHAGALALACESLALALAQVAQAAQQRVLRLLEPRTSGLPQGLTTHADRAGLGPLSLTLSTACSEIRLLAMPASLHGQPLADGVEDVGPQTPLVVSRLAHLVARLGDVVAIELLTAAQACDLREQPLWAPAVARLYLAVRETSPTLDDDRPLGRE